MEGVERANEGGFSKAMKATGKLVGLAALHAGTLGLSTLGILAYKGLKKASENIGRISDYGSGSKLAKSGTIGKVLQTGMSSLKLALWRQTKFHGVSYGDVRDFMLDNGILEWFNQGRILGPIGKAESIVNLLRTKSPSPFSEFSDKNHPWLYSLVWKVLSSHGIKPDSWDRVWDSLDHHKEEQAGFAQSLLEYFGLVVIPSWNKTERMLHNLFSFNGSKEKKEKLKLGLTKQIFRLTKLFTKKSIIDFIYDHLRFPNMKVNVIDYSNATDEQRKKIDEYKKKLGIPDKNEKKKILKSLNKDPGDDVEALKQEMLRIGAQLKKAKFEYRFTGGGYEYI